MSLSGHKTKKIINFKRVNRDCKNYLNKMKILVMNSVTFKIPILTAANYIMTYYFYMIAVKIGILNVIEFITSIFLNPHYFLS